MRNSRTIQEGRLRRVLHALLRYEPTLLAGLTWSHFGYVALLASAFGVARAVQSRDPAFEVAWYWIPMFSLSGLCLLLCAAVLTNVATHRIPRSIVLAIALVVGCALAFKLHSWLGFSAAVPFGMAIHKLRVMLLQWGLVVTAYYFIERSIRRAVELRQAELELHRMEAQMLEARLQVMQAQVEPHFLFNTLAHVQRLYQTQPTRGRSMLDSFCAYLQAALPRMRGNGSTLGKEVDLARAYLDIQQIRMGHRLRHEIAVPPELLAASFPPMMLLSLVENAVKHGLNPLRQGGTIRILAASDDHTLRVTVTDNGIGLSTAAYGAGDGVGLSNIRSRLTALYRDRARFTLDPNTPQGVMATIHVPLTLDRRPGAIPGVSVHPGRPQICVPIASLR